MVFKKIQAASDNDARTVNLLSENLHSVGCASLCSKSEVMLVEVVCYVLCLLASHCLWQNMKLLPVRLAASRENLSKIYYIHIFINLQWLEWNKYKILQVILYENDEFFHQLYLYLTIDLYNLY